MTLDEFFRDVDFRCDGIDNVVVRGMSDEIPAR